MLTDKVEPNFFERKSELNFPMSPEVLKMIVSHLDERALVSLAISSQEMMSNITGIQLKAVMEELQRVKPSFLQSWLASEKNCFYFLLGSVLLGTYAGIGYGGYLGYSSTILNAYVPAFFGSYSESLASWICSSFGASFAGFLGLTLSATLSGGFAGYLAGGAEGAKMGISAASIFPKTSINTAIYFITMVLEFNIRILKSLAGEQHGLPLSIDNPYTTTLMKVTESGDKAVTTMGLFASTCKLAINLSASEVEKVSSQLKVTKKPSIDTFDLSIPKLV